MKRAFWFDGEHMDEQIATVDTTGTHAVHFAKNYNNKSVTENGATGYRTTTKALLDLNFMVSSLRSRDEEYIVCSGESGLNILQSKYNPIISFEGDDVTRDYQAEGLVVSGLLFGFPLESTASLINRIRHLFLCDRKYVE